MVNPLVSIVSVTLNKSGMAKTCLNSIIGYADLPFELIVVDNGSSDDFTLFLDEFEQFAAEAKKTNPYCKNVKLIRNKHNAYICKATNQGFAEASGNLFLFVPSDTIMSYGFLSKMVANMKLYNLDGLSPRWFEPKNIGNEQPDIMDPYNWTTEWAVKFKETKGTYGGNIERGDAEPGWIVGICWLVTREAYESVGGWNERYVLTCMDNDFVWRLLINQWRLAIINDVWIFHQGPFTRMDSTVNPNYQAIGDIDWKETFMDIWGTDPDDHGFLEKLKKEAVIRKKTPEDGPHQGVPPELKQKHITI